MLEQPPRRLCRTARGPGVAIGGGCVPGVVSQTEHAGDLGLRPQGQGTRRHRRQGPDGRAPCTARGRAFHQGAAQARSRRPALVPDGEPDRYGVWAGGSVFVGLVLRDSLSALWYGKVEESSMNALLERITIDPEVCGGRPCIKGTRIWVSLVLDFLADGMTEAELLTEYP